MAIIRSRFPDIAIRDISITDLVFQGIDPGAQILIDGPSGRTIGGAEFMAQVRTLAGGLVARGIGPGSVVALMAPNSPEFCVVFHAVALAGGCVTTVNPTYTAPELRHQLIDAGAGMLVTVAPFLDTARAGITGTPVTQIALIGPAQDGLPGLADLTGTPLPAQVPVPPDHVVCLPYSSGTTGLPKGVMLTHRNLSANADQVLAVSPVIRGERTVAFLPFFHIYGLQVLMNVYLAAGGQVVTMPRFDLEIFLTLCQQHRAKRLWIVPPVALALAKHPMVEMFDLSSVEQINSGAAPLSGDVAEGMAARLRTRATQGYGMTELSPVSHSMPPDLARSGASGLALPNTEARIVDPETLGDRSPGEAGELWVRGPQVMKGYLNNPAATAATITQDGWLRTGDIGHVDADGYLYITDRLKELIKVKGFQVAPAELEALLLAHPAISDAAVIGVPDPEAGEMPVAFVTGTSPPTLEQVQAFLAPQVAHYKQVRALHVIDTIPKNASGKILRRVLRDRMAR